MSKSGKKIDVAKLTNSGKDILYKTDRVLDKTFMTDLSKGKGVCRRARNLAV